MFCDFLYMLSALCCTKHARRATTVIIPPGYRKIPCSNKNHPDCGWYLIIRTSP